jgi:CDP-diacylglycerol---glycerol-3-phosphate 3-phosphatidyltransferase
MSAGPDPAVGAARPPVPVLNVANALTALRLVLVPVFFALTVASRLVHADPRMAATVVFVIASLTDFVDGWIARTWDLVTTFGQVADPIADKALTGTALVLLSWYGRLPWWVTVVILVREIGVTVLRFGVIRRQVIAASIGGKAKTALQILAISWYLWPFSPRLQYVGAVLMAIAVGVTVITGADYVIRAFRRRRAAP